MTTGSSLTKTQQLYSLLHELEERNRKAHLPVFADELLEAMKLLEEIDPDADWISEYVEDPDRQYGR